MNASIFHSAFRFRHAEIETWNYGGPGRCGYLDSAPLEQEQVSGTRILIGHWFVGNWSRFLLEHGTWRDRIWVSDRNSKDWGHTPLPRRGAVRVALERKRFLHSVFRFRHAEIEMRDHRGGPMRLPRLGCAGARQVVGSDFDRALVCRKPGICWSMARGGIGFW